MNPVIPKNTTQLLTDHLNQVDNTGSIKFTHEEESEGKIPFLDAMIVREEDGCVKLQVYRKKTHTDQYLNFNSHHPLHQKLGVVRTLLERSDTIVTTQEDREKEENHVKQALKMCGYPSWTIKKTRDSMLNKQQGKVQVNRKEEGNKNRGMVVIPYVQGLTESVSRIMKTHGVTTAIRPHKTIRNELVKPKDQRLLGETAECVYKIPCANCEKVYVGETGRRLGTRLQEHQKEVEMEGLKQSQYTRSTRLASLSEYHKSAVTDHTLQMNHVIDWKETKVVDREQDRQTRWIKEAIAIRKEGQMTMNRDEGQYPLPNIYNQVLVTHARDKQ